MSISKTLKCMPIKGANSDLDGVWVHNNCFLDMPKQKVNSASVGDIVRTPTTHPDDFIRKKDSQGRIIFVNKYTNDIWFKSNTSHSDKTGEWKVGIGNKEPNKNSKITIGISNGKIIKVNK